MDYQQKYLKYKSKYLEKKYGRQFRLRYKIDNNNDLYYKQKYFKYKSKYLHLKYGGLSKAERAANAASSAAIRENNRKTSGESGYVNPKTIKEEEENLIIIEKLTKKEQEEKEKKKKKNKIIHDKVIDKILNQIEDIGKYDFKDKDDNLLINKICSKNKVIAINNFFTKKENKSMVSCYKKIISILKKANTDNYDLSKEIDINNWLHNSFVNAKVIKKGYVNSIKKLKNWLLKTIVDDKYSIDVKSKIILSSYINPSIDYN